MINDDLWQAYPNLSLERAIKLALDRTIDVHYQIAATRILCEFLVGHLKARGALDENFDAHLDAFKSSISDSKFDGKIRDKILAEIEMWRAEKPVDPRRAFQVILGGKTDDT